VRGGGASDRQVVNTFNGLPQPECGTPCCVAPPRCSTVMHSLAVMHPLHDAVMHPLLCCTPSLPRGDALSCCDAPPARCFDAPSAVMHPLAAPWRPPLAHAMPAIPSPPFAQALPATPSHLCSRAAPTSPKRNATTVAWLRRGGPIPRTPRLQPHRRPRGAVRRCCSPW